MAEELRLTASLAEPDSLSVFQQSIPADWIEEALQASGTASIRRRKLPAEQVVWLVLGMGLYRNRSIADVCDKLS
ncbi:transposase domain-containing protein, partial [Methylohalomonas lacus]